MKKWIIIISALMVVLEVSAQRYITKNGHIKFYSETPMETIEANNHQVNSALDISNGDFVFKVLMKSFEFEKALMQEHFNENYVESDKYPNSTFKGKILNISDYDFKSNNSYDVVVEGDLSMHGVTKKVTEKGTLTVSNNGIEGKAIFIVNPEDYKIKIPKTVVDNIAEELEVTVHVKLEEYKN